MTLQRKVEFEPGHDCIRFECINGSPKCLPGSGGSHGRHGLNMRFVVIGEKGAVQFLLYTDWMPEPPGFGEERFEARLFPPSPADLGYHSKTPRYEGQAPNEKCEYTGGNCYYDGSGLNAYEPFRVLCNEGGEALWLYLEAYYAATFDGGEYPEAKPYKLARRSVPR